MSDPATIASALHALLNEVARAGTAWRPTEDLSDPDPIPSYVLVRARELIAAAKAVGRWDGRRVTERAA